jgi:hypothetical protein
VSRAPFVVSLPSPLLQHSSPLPTPLRMHDALEHLYTHTHAGPRT